MGVVVNSEGRLKTAVINANSTVSVASLDGEGIRLYSVYFQGQATGETDVFVVSDSNGNIFYSATASGVANIPVPAGLNLIVNASGTVTATGRVNIIYSGHY